MEHDVFISYSSKEKSVADGVCHYLEDNGVKCWMAPRDIPVGTDYGDLIDEAIKSCRVVVLVYSQHSFISKWVKGEINVAFDEGKPIAPFRIDETGIKGAFRVMLNQMHWIDAYPSYADRLPDLLRSICGFIGREVPEPQRIVAVAEEEPKDATESEEHFLKVRCTLDCRLFIDRDECATLKAGDITKIPLHQGEYLVQVTTIDGLDTIEQELDMPAADKLLFFDLLALQKERLAVEQQLKEEAERKRKEEEERKKKEETERKAKEEAERKAKEEAARNAKEEADRKALAEAREQRARERIAQKAEKVEKAKDKGRREVNPGYVLVGQGLTELGKKDISEFREKENIQVANSVVKINSKAFEDIAVLKNIILPRRLKRIEEYAFWGCSALEKIEIPASVAEINSYAFLDCCGLKELVFADNATIVKIGQGAFSGCKQLEKVVIPISVGEVDVEAFWKCDNLKEVILRNPNTEYKKYHGFLLKPSFPKHTKIIIG